MKTRMFGINGFQILAIALGLVTTNAFASPKTINFATGQDSNGNIQLIGNSLDANWKESGGANPKNPPNSYVVAPGNGDWGPSWLHNGPDSSWIAPNPNDIYGNGTFTITYTFDLSGYDSSSATFRGLQWAIDDGGTLVLNGHLEASLPGAEANWTAFHPFTMPTNHLLQGVNTLQIIGGASDFGYEGSRVEGTLTISPIPEPETYAMLLAGLGLVTFIASRRNFLSRV